MINGFKKYTDYTDNGLKIIALEIPHLHNAEISCFVRMGSRYETSQDNGISHFFEHMIFRGTKKMNQKKLACIAESFGGSFNAFTTRDYAQFTMQLHPQFIHQGIKIVAHVLTEPIFRDIELEKEIILEERLSDVNTKDEDINVDNLSRKLLWGNKHPLGFAIIGTPDSIRGVTKAKLASFHLNVITVENMLVVIASPHSPNKIIEEAKKYFHEIPAGKKITPLPPPKTNSSKKIHITYEDNANTELSFSFKTFPISSEKQIPFMILRKVLDGGMSSRLYQSLCAEKGLAYDIDTQSENFEDCGVFDITLSTSHTKVKDVILLLFKELDKMYTKGITAEELTRTKQMELLDMELALDSTSYLSTVYAGIELFMPTISYKQRRERIKNISRQTVNAIAQEVLAKENCYITIVGPIKNKKEIEKIIKI